MPIGRADRPERIWRPFKMQRAEMNGRNTSSSESAAPKTESGSRFKQWKVVTKRRAAKGGAQGKSQHVIETSNMFGESDEPESEDEKTDAAEEKVAEAEGAAAEKSAADGSVGRAPVERGAAEKRTGAEAERAAAEKIAADGSARRAPVGAAEKRTDAEEERTT